MQQAPPVLAFCSTSQHTSLELPQCKRSLKAPDPLQPDVWLSNNRAKPGQRHQTPAALFGAADGALGGHLKAVQQPNPRHEPHTFAQQPPFGSSHLPAFPPSKLLITQEDLSSQNNIGFQTQSRTGREVNDQTETLFGLI